MHAQPDLPPEPPAAGDDALTAPGTDPAADALAVPPVTRRAVLLSGGSLAAAVLLVVLLLMPVPYAVNSPGPTLDTLGSHDGTELITIDGAPTYDATGELRLTTVSTTGGPGYPSSVLGVLAGWVSPSQLVVPVESVFPQDATQEQLDQQNEAQMVSSQENATVAALEELGYDVPVTLTVHDAVPGSGAEGVVEPGDVLLDYDGTALTSYGQLIDLLAATAPGATVTLGVRRDGADVDLDVVTGEREDGDGSQLGVYIDPEFDPPVDVTIQIDRIGGSSAGTMFALGIIDRLTPEDEAAGQVIAGTGTMDLNGDVGPIGGIRQKMAGALRDGARWFLAPADNCDEVVGHVPDGLDVVRISTLHEAREAVAAIGAGETGDLPSCTTGDAEG
ncbi:PDZ domain-containing protein [Cellulomonas sp. C5510]|uniref:YlbL family protein n=1 Tax=Cellulomonas sp. C5510 TaxID=2871170 RepID=UPI001C969EA1|nr:PDZ domain-containing protein [Cellulomonas sp. C5510]QZN84934.1 PDZ domain-containing protein [Cellulomonas sp. C5510]